MTGLTHRASCSFTGNLHRAVPTGFRLGVYSKIWAPFLSRAPPKKKFSGKQKFFWKMLPRGGGSRRYFFENKSSRNLSQNNFLPEISKIFSEEILHFLKFLQFQHARAPFPQVGPPLFYFFWGCVTPPPTPPRWHGPEPALGNIAFPGTLHEKNPTSQLPRKCRVG